MAYDEQLADWVRTLLKSERTLEEKRISGGLGMLVNGNMAVAVRGKGGLLVRIDPDDADDVLSEPGVNLMKMRGKAMRGWITGRSEGMRPSCGRAALGEARRDVREEPAEEELE